MSFDLYFCRREQSDVTVDELREWIARHEHFTEHEYEGTYKFDYENEDTGVYFSIAHGFPDWLPGSSREEDELPRFTEDVFPVSIDARTNVMRPSFFAHEAMPWMVDLARSFDLLMGNPQDQKDAPEREPPASYLWQVRFGDSEAGEEGRASDDDRDRAATPHWEDGKAPPRFPEDEMEPRFYSSEELIRDWERMNAWSIHNLVRKAERRDWEVPSDLTRIASRRTSMDFWRYMRDYRELKSEYEELFVARAYFVIRPGSNRVESAAVWPGPCGAILPPVDNFVIPRQERQRFLLWPRKKRQEMTGYLIEPGRVLEVLAPFLDDFDRIEGAKLVSQEKILDDTEEDGAFERAQAFYETVEFEPKDAEYEFLAADEFVDTGIQPAPRQ